MISINSSFIGDFKVGDNINHNLDILKILYSCCESNTQSKSLLNKPITIIIISIIEALLYDFHHKAKYFTKEGVGNIASTVLNYIRGKKIDKFNEYIKSARKHNILKTQDQQLYDDLEELRKLRNRIHIQNEKKDFEPDESVAFSNERNISAEKALEKIMKIMSSQHKREQKCVKNFVLPWQPHCKTELNT